MYIDAHAHIHDPKYDKDRDAIIKRAQDADVEKIITIGTDLENSRIAIATAEKYEDVFATVALHPHEYTSEEHFTKNQQDVLLLETLAKHKKVVAIGECGLDYYPHGGTPITDAQKKRQKAGLLAHIAIAQRVSLPLVIHCRDAYNDLLSLLEGEKGFPPNRIVLHCYGGNTIVTQKLLDYGVWFSFAGNVTFSKRETDEINTVLRIVPLERMLIETDCPFLAPVPYRGLRNEPSYVTHVAAYIARVRKESIADVSKKTYDNTQAFFMLQ